MQFLSVLKCFNFIISNSHFCIFGIGKYFEWLLWCSLGSLQGSTRRFLHFGEICVNFPISANVDWLFVLKKNILFQVMDILGPSLWDVWNSLGQS